jgi:hypothetical protein
MGEDERWQGREDTLDQKLIAHLRARPLAGLIAAAPRFARRLGARSTVPTKFTACSTQRRRAFSVLRPAGEMYT